jgi:phosphoserine phosphatase RsbU/P
MPIGSPKTHVAQQPPSLSELAGGLVSAPNSRALLASVEELLSRLSALPARIFLYDGEARAFYAAISIGCPKEAPDIPLSQAMAPTPEHHFLLSDNNQPVGLLQTFSTTYAVDGVLQLCAVLGPALLVSYRQESTTGQLTHAQDQVKHLSTAAELLKTIDVEVLLVKILETVLSAVHAQVGAVLTSEDEGDIRPRISWGLRNDHIDAIRFSSGQSVASAVSHDGRTICLSRADILEQLDVSRLDAHLTGLMALPLSTGGRRRGVVLLANPEHPFDANDQSMAEAVCGMAAIALDNALLVKSTVDRERMQKELDIARTVQESMYPVGSLEKYGMRIDGASRQCSETGGDYYNYLEQHGHLITMIGDVSGHGLGAALFTTTAHAIIQQQLRARLDIEEVFEVLNESLFHSNSGRFMTAAAVQIDPKDGCFSYVSAGHNPLLWLHGEHVCWLESCGVPLGVLVDAEFPRPPSGVLARGDYLLMYTDGITEALNQQREVYGDQRLAHLVRGLARKGVAPSDLIQAIFDDVDHWSGRKAHDDDLTMVAIAIT